MNDLKFSILVRGWGNLTEHFVGERARFLCFRWCVVVGIGCGVGSFFQGCRPSAAPRVEVVEETKRAVPLDFAVCDVNIGVLEVPLRDDMVDAVFASRRHEAAIFDRPVHWSSIHAQELVGGTVE